MKKNLWLYIIAVLALSVSSCTPDFLPGDEDGFGFRDGQTGLMLNVFSTNPETRAIAPPTEYNEDRLEQFYYFLYQNDPSSEGHTGDAPVFAGKWSAPVDNGGTATIVTGTGTVQNITLDDLTALQVSETKYAGYVYVIANYKVAETLAAWDAIIGSTTPDYSSLTWSYFQNLPLPATFQTYDIVTEDIWNPKQDEGHRFKAQDSFIMASAPTKFEVTKGTAGTINAPLERLAVKLNLDINMAKWYVQRNNGVYKYTWYSDPIKTQVYLNYAADKGTLDGEPINYVSTGEGANTGDFFTYRRFAFLSQWTKNGDEYVFPAGDYSEKEPLKWILNPTLAAETQPYQGQYYTADEDLKGKVVEIGGDIQYREFTRPAYKITGTPFYSYPYDFSGDSGHAPFFKVIVEWTAMDETAEGATMATDTTPGENGFPDIIAREFYYKITIPDFKVFEANNWYTIKLNLSTLGSEADETAIDVTSDAYFVANWSDPTQADKPDINAGRFLKVAGNSFDMYGNTLQIPVTASGPLVITAYDSTSGNPTATYPLGTSTTNTGSLTYSTTSSTGVNFMVTPDLDAQYVQIDHTILPFSTSFSANNGNAKDIALITYKFRISLSGHSDLYEDITVTQYPSIYVARQQSRGRPFVNGTGNGTPNNAHSYTLGPVSNDAGSRSTYFTIVSISTLSGLADTYPNWMIGDSRIRLADAYNGTYENEPSYTVYSTSNNDTQWRRTDLGSSPNYFDKYLVGAGNASNVIAPKFMLATGYGYRSSLTNSTWKSNSERCATYQEDGYPAGRWRLPTEAEILFCATLASHGLIESPFVNNTRYWATSGGNLQYTSNGSNWDFSYTYNQQTVSIRCIYDLWYWGDDPVVTPGTYTVMLPE